MVCGDGEEVLAGWVRGSCLLEQGWQVAASEENAFDSNDFLIDTKQDDVAAYHKETRLFADIGA